MKIVNFGQIVNLERGVTLAHQLTVELPSGRRQQVLTDEVTVQQLLDFVSDVGNAPRSVEQKTPDSMLERDIALDAEGLGEEAYDDGSTFGGDYDPGEVRGSEAFPREVSMGVLAESPVRSDTAPRGGIGQPSPTPRPPVDSEGFYLPPPARTVPKDELGYPIVQQRARPPTVPDDDGEGDGTQI